MQSLLKDTEMRAAGGMDESAQARRVRGRRELRQSSRHPPAATRATFQDSRARARVPE